MIVDSGNRFVTGRQFPSITLIKARPAASGLLLAAPGMPNIMVQIPAGLADIPARVWDDVVMAATADSNANEWITAYLGIDAKLVYMRDEQERSIDPAYSLPGDFVSFADGFPLLLISESSLDLLNSKLETPVPVTRFRPNLVVNGAIPHAEDGWLALTIGAVRFDVVKTCTRCNFVNVDPESGERARSGQPLKTLAGYRKSERGIEFGRYLIPRSTGYLHVGDRVEVVG